MDTRQRCPASIGPIRAEEQLAYGIYSPDILDPSTRQLTAEAIKLDNLIGKSGRHVDCCGSSSGLSVARVDTELGFDELRNVINSIVKRPRKDGTPRKSEGYATIRVEEVLGLEDNMLIVLDDGCSCFTSHAVIRGRTQVARAALRGVRNDLVSLLNRTIKHFE
jgi:hypothetical protein